MNKLNQSQETRILEVLQNVNGRWVNKQKFMRNWPEGMGITQAGRALHNLQKFPARYGYDGVIEASPFKDDFGFKSFRLVDFSVQKREQIQSDFQKILEPYYQQKAAQEKLAQAQPRLL